MGKFLGASPIPFRQVEEQVFDDHVRSCSVGIDCHRDSYHVYVLALNQETRQIVERYCKFGVHQPDMDAIRQFIIEAEGIYQDTVDLVILESTGPYSRTLFEFLAKQWGTCLINPVEFSKYGKKTDKFDARKMAQLALQGLFHPSFLTTNQEEDLKRVSRLMIKVRNAQIRESNSLNSLLIHAGIGITRGTAAIQLMSVSGRQILQAIIAGKNAHDTLMAAEYYDPAKISKDTKKTEQRIGTHLALKEALRKVDELSASARRAIKVKFDSYLHYENRFEELDNELEQMLRAYEVEGLNGWDAVEFLRTIPSIGRRNAMLLVCEATLRLRERFGAPQEKGDVRWVSYCGFNPARQYSADKETSVRRASPGNAVIRSALVESSQSLLKSRHPLGDRVRVIERRNGGRRSSMARNLAVVAGAGKLAKAAYWVLFKREAFDDKMYDYTVVKRENAKKVERLLKQFEQVQTELRSDQDGEALVLQMKQKLQGQMYILNPSAAILQPVSAVFASDKRVLKALVKIGCERVSDVWCFLQTDTLKAQKGIGDKTHEQIVQTLMAANILQQAA